MTKIATLIYCNSNAWLTSETVANKHFNEPFYGISVGSWLLPTGWKLPSMSLNKHLFTCEDPSVWRGIYEKYWQVVELKSDGKGKKQGKLLPLDKWYQEELPAAVASRSERFLTHSELVKLMEWKLTRGKFRPRLQQLVATNSSETVERCTKKAFSLLPDVNAAITELSSLKALGPATASAVLAAGAPGQAAFMADEAVESIPSMKPIQYTAKHYSLYLQRVEERTQALNKVDTDQDWTPHKVELCLWAWAVASQLQPSLLQDSCDEETETSKPRAKRQKIK
ncbi:hypothetical protein SKAU_G00129780 [Synaphobranchus kaupii]|uniref:Uncharacterized protein n=1 Tax=Synaphobranchus kaupii TaxID=118154 RepID=A0A9Q1FQA7_SYNKA|nr:hypothetical protein SKAU_G00129780 [Synaphobranchus kaupii]